MEKDARSLWHQDNDIIPMGYVCLNVIDGFLFNLNIKPGTACRHTVKYCLVLYFWQWSWIYQTTWMMIHKMWFINSSRKFTSKWGTAICSKGRSVLTVSVLCGVLSMHFLSSSQLQSYKLHSRGTVCIQDAFFYQWFTGAAHLPSSAQRHSNRAVHNRSASDCRENLLPLEPYWPV